MAESEAGTGTMTAETRGRLGDVRRALLRLHRALLEAERLAYERGRGRVGGGEFLQLVINDPWFAWLRPVSELVVHLDELLEAEPPASEEDALNTFRQAAALVRPDAGAGEFGRRYREALQVSPEVVMAHAGAAQLLRPTAGREGMSEAEIDETLDETYPASDPPSWTLGTDHAPDNSAGAAERPGGTPAPGEGSEEP